MTTATTIPARIVQREDSAAATAQTAVRLRPPRSTPKALVVEPATPAMVRGIVTDFHYLHSMPAAPRRCFGVYHDGALAGAVVFTAGARQGYHLGSDALLVKG